MLNKVLMIGRLTGQPVQSTSPNTGRAITKFSLAVQKNNKSGLADFWNVVVFDKLAENISNYLTKGSLIYLEGSIQQNTYTNNEGRKITSFNIIGNSVVFLDNKNSNLASTTNVAKQADSLANEMLQNFQTQIPSVNNELTFGTKGKVDMVVKNSDEIEEDIEWEK